MSDEAYLIRDISRPIETIAIVYETAARAARGRVYVFLEHHEEPNVVRGIRQPLERPDLPEFKRPDTGRSWYHPKTRCFMRGKPLADSRDSQAAWAVMMKAHLSGRGYAASQLRYNDGDIFFCNGSKRHLMGTSIWVPPGRETQVVRACWYEESPMAEISDLLKADGIEPSEFEQCNDLVKAGLFDYLVQSHSPSVIAVNDFVSSDSLSKALELQKQKDGDVRGPCVTGWKR